VAVRASTLKAADRSAIRFDMEYSPKDCGGRRVSPVTRTTTLVD
jgi:hypothetical protein